jgi:hypothetical protein
MFCGCYSALGVLQEHIPAGLMARKLQEFVHMQKGLGSVYEYNKRFNHLS